MAILIKGTDFAEGTPVTDVALDALVDAATFDTGAVDDVSTQLSGGAIIVKDGGVTPAKLSTGKPVWDTSGNVGIGISVPTSKLHVSGTGADIIVADSTVGTRMVASAANAIGIIETSSNHPLVFRTNQIECARIAASGAITLGKGGTTGTNITINDYTTGTTRQWSIRDDSGVDRLRFARGSTDYSFWDVLKTVGADSVASQIWECVLSHTWKVNGTTRAVVSATGLAITGDLSVSGTTINAANLPTSASGLASGDLWVDAAASYVVKRVP